MQSPPTNDQTLDGTGLGLRSEHISEVLSNKPKVPWFEILIDNYLNFSPLSFSRLEKIRADYPLTFHSVGMNLGSVDGINKEYFAKIKQLSASFNPIMVSDHLCFTAINAKEHHDLLPLPYTEEALETTVRNIQMAQETLGYEISIENPSSYITFNSSTMTEEAFMNELAKRSGCRILLDINNIYVSSKNHGFDPLTYIQTIEPTHVSQFHLAGFEDRETHLLDSHSRPIDPRVWDLFSKAVALIGAKPTIIEWDNDLPELEVLIAEAQKADALLSKVGR